VIRRIESRKNPQFKQWLAISQSDLGRKKGLVFLEGLRLCQDAAASGVTIETVLLSDHAGPPIQTFADSLTPATHYCLPESLFRTLCDTKTPQGIALLCDAPDLSHYPEKPNPNGLYLVADGISDPGNLGTMIRTADAFAFDAVLMTAGSVWPMHAKVIRAAMGSAFHLPLYWFESIEETIDWLKSGGIQVIAADIDGAQPVSDLPSGGGRALIIGSEAHGISPVVRSRSDQIICIPMPGRAESLNAAVAAAILSYAMMEKNREIR
jgi:TrmH family RNA methyltransferase